MTNTRHSDSKSHENENENKNKNENHNGNDQENNNAGETKQEEKAMDNIDTIGSSDVGSSNLSVGSDDNDNDNDINKEIAWDSVLRGLISNKNTFKSATEIDETMENKDNQTANGKNSANFAGNRRNVENRKKRGCLQCLKNCKLFWFDKRETYVDFRQSAHEALLECKNKLVVEP